MTSAEQKHDADFVDEKAQDYPSSPTEDGFVGKKMHPKGFALEPQPSDDPKDPLNWSLSKKCTIFFLMAFSTFTGISTAVANVLATPEQAVDWGVSSTQAAYSVSAVLAGIIVGPVLLVPLVTVFGVMSCCFWSMVGVVLTSVWSALSTGPSGYSSFMAARAVAGLFSGTSQVFVSGVIAQIFFLHQRGKAFAVYSTVYLVATVAGPTFSGFIVETSPWPVAFWWTVGANALAGILILLLGEDTTWDRERNIHPARKQLPESWAARRVALFFPGTRVVPPIKFRNITHSLTAVFAIGFSPITVLAGIYNLISFGWFIMAGVQIPILLQEPFAPAQGSLGYGFSPRATGFFYFSAWIGAILGVLYGILLNDRLPLYLQRKRGGVWKTEYRLQTAWFPGLIIGPIGCGIFGACVLNHWHWIVLAVAEVFIVFAAVTSVPIAVNYIIEIFKEYPQEVATALNVWRIGFSIAIQFFYMSWVEAVGVQWTWGTAAFLSLFGFGMVVLLMIFGPRLMRYNLWDDSYRVKSKA